MNVIITKTKDNSHTIYLPHLDEHYHSTFGAIQESEHIYIHACLRQCKKNQIHVLEIGFGTGLNAFLSLREAVTKNKKIVYTSLELYPLSIDTALKLNYPAITNPSTRSYFEAIHKADWNNKIAISDNFILHKIETDFSNCSLFETDQRFDVVYFDAFAPNKQAEMWTQTIFDKLFSLCNNGAIMSTYCAKGEVRRMMQASGFVVERLSGPPGKREILVARKV